MNKYELPIPLPSQGINCIDDSIIHDNEAAEGTKNISFRDGIPQTRKGYIKYSPYQFTNEVGSLFSATFNQTQNVLAVSNKKLYKKNSNSFDQITGTLDSNKIETLNYAVALAGGVAYGDKLFILDGKTYQYWDGTNSIASVPVYSPTTEETSAYGTNVLNTTPDEINKQKFILNDDERIWVAGYGKLVRISHLQKPDYFPSTHVWKLEEDCTGMARFMGEVVLFTANTATLINGATPIWSLPEKYIYTKLPGGFGCDSHRSIAIGNNALYWANKDGVYRYRYLPSGYSIPECVSEFQTANGIRSIKKYISGISDWSMVHAEFFENEYRLYIGNKQVLVFDTISSTWAFYEYDKEFNCGAIIDKKLYCAKGYIYNIDYTYDPLGNGFDGLSDDGTAIEYRLKSKFFDFGKAANKKRFKKMYYTLYSEFISYDIDLNINLDNENYVVENQIINSITRWGMFRFGDLITNNRTNLNYPIKIHHKGKKYNIQYEMVCTGLNMAFMLISLVLIAKMKELK